MTVNVRSRRLCSELKAEWAAQRIKGLSFFSAAKAAFFGNKGNKIKSLIDEIGAFVNQVYLPEGDQAGHVAAHDLHDVLTREAAVEHMFSVAAGLDSMVVGESQILGQLRLAYNASSEVGVVATVLKSPCASK